MSFVTQNGKKIIGKRYHHLAPCRQGNLPKGQACGFFSSPAPISSFLRGKRLCNDKEVFAGFVMISKLFKLSYLTARAPAKSHVHFRLCLRKNKQYNGSHVQFHDCQVSSSITQ